MLNIDCTVEPHRNPQPSAGPAPTSALSLRAFLAQVETVLQTGLPTDVWIEATVAAVRAGTHGYALELIDSKPAKRAAQLTVFLSKAALATIHREISLPLDPALLSGMSIVTLIQPTFDVRWHLGARMVRLAGGITDSIRRRVIEGIVASLRRDGSFGAQRRLSPPADVTRVVVVHPAAAAGWDDIKAALARWETAGLVQVRSVPTPFEGETAASGIMAALARAVEPIAGSPPDVILLVRGGGGRAGLFVFDTELVARAICQCRVPVLTGLGHAGDTTLADQVAWRRADTPSKALGEVAAIIGRAARKTEADRAYIAQLAARAADRADGQLATMASALAREMESSVAGAEAALAACWSRTRVAATAIRGGLDRQAERLERLMADQGQYARGVIEAAEQACRRRRTEIADRAWRALSRADAGGALLAGVGAHLCAALDHAGCELDRAYASVHERIWRQLEIAETALGQIAPVLDARDIARTLERGFVLVRNQQGKGVVDRRQAVGEQVLTLNFRDGELAVRPLRGP